MRTYLAIELTTDDGYGQPIAYTNSGLGAQSGVFYWITGRPPATMTTVTGDSARTVWYPNIIADDEDFQISEDANFVQAGCLANVSSFSFSILNTQATAFVAALRNAAFTDLLGNSRTTINLTKCRVKVFYVETADDLTFEFTQIGQFTVDAQPFDELHYQIHCTNDALELFQSLPTQAADKARFANLPEDMGDKMVPIAIGRVAYSPLLSVAQLDERTALCFLNGVDINVCAAHSYNSTTLVIALYTQGVDFHINDDRLVGRFLTPIAGMAKQSRRIISNSSTVKYGGNSTPSYTFVVISESFDNSQPFVSYETGGSSVTFFEVSKYSVTLVASTRPISEFKDGPTGDPRLYVYDGTEKKFLDISDVRLLDDATNIKNSGFPGFQVNAKNLDTSGDVAVYFPIRPTSAMVTNLGLGGAGSGAGKVTFDGDVNTSIEEFIDGDQATYKTFTGNATLGYATFKMKLELPKDLTFKQFDELYLLLDFQHGIAAGTHPQRIDLDIYGADMYGRTTPIIVNGHILINSSYSAGFHDKYLLPGTYYDLEANSADFYTHKTTLSISELIDNLKKMIAYPSLLLVFKLNYPVLSSLVIRMREIGLVGKRSVNFASEVAYTSLIGETFGSTWNARRTADDPVLLGIDALEMAIREYDVDVKPWRSRAYRLGEKVRSIDDNGHIYLCTVAGSSGSTEPVFPTTTGATVTDGAVTWRECKTIPIDESSFDSMREDFRYTSPVGRTLTEKKDSKDYYQELLRHLFLGLYFGPTGKVSLSSWLDDTDPFIAFTAANMNAGTVGEMTLTPMDDVCNYGRIRYGHNPASQQFTGQYAVDKIDYPSFPPPTELVHDYDGDLGAFTITATKETGLYGAPRYFYRVTTTNPHPLVSGDMVSLIDNTDGFNFTNRKVNVETDHIFNLQVFSLSSWTSPSTSGTVYKQISDRIAWHEFVSGVDDYQEAKAIWEQFHLSWLVTKVKKAWSEDLGDCHWFLDPRAQAPGSPAIDLQTFLKPTTTDDDLRKAGFLWPDLARLGLQHPPFFLLKYMMNWTAWQKYQLTFETDFADPAMQLHVFSPVSVNDAKQTSGETWIGWIHKIDRIKGAGKNPDKLRLSVTFAPTQVATPTRILESGEQAVNILESGTRATNYIEGAQ